MADERDWKHFAKMSNEAQKPALRQTDVIRWVAVSELLPEFGETVLVYCKIYGRFLATYEFIGEFQGEKYGNWRDFNGNLGILQPVYWLQIPEPPCL
jgi:hypothetical protein